MKRILSFTVAVALTGCDGGAKQLVRDRLTDPDSAEFSEISNEDGVTCGLVNSKNRLGGYTGRELFVVRNGEAYFASDGEAFINAKRGAGCTHEASMVFIRQLNDDIRSMQR